MAADAVLIDTTGMPIDQVVDRARASARSSVASESPDP